MSLDEIGLQNFPRVPLAFLPTPIMEALRLAAEIDGPKLWIKRDDLNRGVINLRQRRDRQLLVSSQADKQNCRHQKCGGDRPQNENTRRIHEDNSN